MILLNKFKTIDEEKVLNKRKPIKYLWKSKFSFEESLEVQNQLRSCFFGFEPKSSVVSQGLKACSEDLIWPKEKFKEKDIQILQLKRGGQTTLHSPGQLLIYPILHLNDFKLKIKDFILMIEKITQDVLKDLNISSQSIEKYAGLSTEQGKIAFFGIHVSQGWSQHGLSISVKNDLELFESIKSCGQASRPHDNIRAHNVFLSLEEIFYLWCEKASLSFEKFID